MRKPKPKPKPKGLRTQRLCHTLNTLLSEAVKAGTADPKAANASDLAALIAVVMMAEQDLPVAGNVPEWDNWTEDDGTLYRLGSVAHNYAEWSKESDEPACDHDGASQLAELAQALTDSINALDCLVYDQHGQMI